MNRTEPELVLHSIFALQNGDQNGRQVLVVRSIQHRGYNQLRFGTY